MSDETPEPTIRDRVIAKLQREFCRSVDVEEINDDHDLENDLGMDSLDAYELIMLLEEEFDIEIPEQDWMDVKTKNVRNLVKLVQTRVDVG